MWQFKQLLCFSTLSLLLFLFHLHLRSEHNLLVPSHHSLAPPVSDMWDQTLRYASTVQLPVLPDRGGGHFTLLIGILTRADLYNRRHLLRLVYGVQLRLPTTIAEIHIKFVLCELTKEEQKIIVALEIMRFQDIILLNCTENMNKGKTYNFLASLPKILPQQYDYVMKADDDVFIRLEALVNYLMPLERKDLYFGFVLPCANKNPHVGYMSGMAFALSWDIVEWIAASDIPLREQVGPEDKMVGRWLVAGGKGKNRATAKPGMYDYPGTNGQCSHELIQDTIAVHRLKRWDRWHDVLRFFNVTGRLKPSKMYFIDQ